MKKMKNKGSKVFFDAPNPLCVLEFTREYVFVVIELGKKNDVCMYIYCREFGQGEGQESWLDVMTIPTYSINQGLWR